MFGALAIQSHPILFLFIAGIQHQDKGLIVNTQDGKKSVVQG